MGGGGCPQRATPRRGVLLGVPAARGDAKGRGEGARHRGDEGPRRDTVIGGGERVWLATFYQGYIANWSGNEDVAGYGVGGWDDRLCLSLAGNGNLLGDCRPALMQSFTPPHQKAPGKPTTDCQFMVVFR